MAAKTDSNGRVVMVDGDTFDADCKKVQPVAVIWSGGTTAAHKACFTDADGVTHAMMSIAAAGECVALTKEYWGCTRPMKTPITAVLGSGVIFMEI